MKNEENDKKDPLTEEEKEQAQKKLEEELYKAMENDETFQKRKRFALMFSYGLSSNLLTHILLSLVVNIVIFSVVLGITQLGLIQDHFIYLLCIILFTFVEISIKITLRKLVPGLLIRSLGIVDLIIEVLLFYTIFELLEGIVFNHAYKLFVYVLLFSILRFIVSYHIRKFFYNKKRGLR